MNFIEQMKNRKLLSTEIEVAFPSKEEMSFKLKVKRPPAVEINELTERARRIVSSYDLDKKSHNAEFLEQLGTEYFKLVEKHITGWESTDGIEFNAENKAVFFEVVMQTFKAKSLGYDFMAALRADETGAGKKFLPDTAKPVENV